MEHHLWRLSWALPLVLAIGVLSILALKRWGITRLRGPAQANEPEPELRLVADLRISDDTRIFLLETGGQRWLITESRQHTATQVLPAQSTT